MSISKSAFERIHGVAIATLQRRARGSQPVPWSNADQETVAAFIRDIAPSILGPTVAHTSVTPCHDCGTMRDEKALHETVSGEYICTLCAHARTARKLIGLDEAPAARTAARLDNNRRRGAVGNDDPHDPPRAEPKMRHWLCAIGPVSEELIPATADALLRAAVEAAFYTMFGEDSKVTSSGWQDGDLRLSDEQPARTPHDEPRPARSTESFAARLHDIAGKDITVLVQKDAEYGSSWKQRGGIGAYMMLARKWDRIEQAVRDYGWDIFAAARTDTRDEGIRDDIRDLRRYLLLVDQEVL